MQMRSSAEQHLRVSREIDDKVGIADGLWQMGESNVQLGDIETGREYLEESLEMARQENFPNLIAGALMSLARLARLDGDNSRAIELYRECAQIYGQMMARGALAWTLRMWGQVLLQEQEPVEANELFEECLAIYKDMRIDEGQAVCLAGFAGVAGISRQDVKAARLDGAYIFYAEKYNFEASDLFRQVHESILAAVRERLGEDRFQAEWEAGQKLTLEQALELAQQL